MIQLLAVMVQGAARGIESLLRGPDSRYEDPTLRITTDPAERAELARKAVALSRARELTKAYDEVIAEASENKAQSFWFLGMAVAAATAGVFSGVTRVVMIVCWHVERIFGQGGSTSPSDASSTIWRVALFMFAALFLAFAFLMAHSWIGAWRRARRMRRSHPYNHPAWEPYRAGIEFRTALLPIGEHVAEMMRRIDADA